MSGVLCENLRERVDYSYYNRLARLDEELIHQQENIYIYIYFSWTYYVFLVLTSCAVCEPNSIKIMIAFIALEFRKE